MMIALNLPSNGLRIRADFDLSNIFVPLDDRVSMMDPHMLSQEFARGLVSTMGSNRLICKSYGTPCSAHLRGVIGTLYRTR